MEILIIVIPLLFFWWVARVLGWMFNGPRHRARVRRRHFEHLIAVERWRILDRKRRRRDYW